MPGQCFLMPSCTWANNAGSEDELSSGLRTWIWTSEAPASKASWVDSICSDTVTGSAGLSFLRGTEPVIATVMTAGLMIFPPLKGSIIWGLNEFAVFRPLLTPLLGDSLVDC